MSETKSKIESLLFISAKPMSVKQLIDLIGEKKEDEIKEACEKLVENYKENGRGIQIIKNGNKYQMVSSPENAGIVQTMIKDETTGELSRPSLETLTIIAYRGPIRKAELEKIRGVNCSMILRNLLLRGLVELKSDRDEDDGLYSVSFDFIRFLGVNDVKELPDYERLSSDDILGQMINEVRSDDNKNEDKDEDGEIGNSKLEIEDSSDDLTEENEDYEDDDENENLKFKIKNSSDDEEDDDDDEYEDDEDEDDEEDDNNDDESENLKFKIKNSSDDDEDEDDDEEEDGEENENLKFKIKNSSDDEEDEDEDNDADKEDFEEEDKDDEDDDSGPIKIKVRVE